MLNKMKEQGQDPPALRNRPELLDRLAWYFDCFQEMSSDRSYAEGTPLRLTTGQMHSYWKAYELYNFEDFSRMIRLIDSIWSDKTRVKRDSVASAKTVPKGSPPPRLK